MNRRLLLPAFLIPGDYLARLLHQGDIGWGLMLAGSQFSGQQLVAADLVERGGAPPRAAKAEAARRCREPYCRGML